MPPVCRDGAITIGNFDGVHLGHQALVRETTNQAQHLGGPAVAITFDPPPIKLLRPELARPPLTTIPYRTALLHEHGADHVLVLRTSVPMLQLSATDFFHQIVVQGLGAKAMIEGFNFAFGRKREGTVDMLHALCAQNKLTLTLMPPQKLLDQPVSSSRIRAALETGDVQAAAELLGRPHRVTGRVGPGQKRGATIGFPTANLHEVETLLPGVGVYAVRVHLVSPLPSAGEGLGVMGGTTWPGAANVGPNPTFGESALKVEVHLIGFSGDLYGSCLSVDFIRKLRDTKKFSNMQELTDQIRADVVAAANII